MLKGSLLCSWWMGVAENQTHSNSLLPTNEEDPFKNEGARVVTTDLPL